MSKERQKTPKQSNSSNVFATPSTSSNRFIVSPEMIRTVEHGLEKEARMMRRMKKNLQQNSPVTPEDWKLRRKNRSGSMSSVELASPLMSAGTPPALPAGMIPLSSPQIYRAPSSPRLSPSDRTSPSTPKSKRGSVTPRSRTNSSSPKHSFHPYDRPMFPPSRRQSLPNLHTGMLPSAPSPTRVKSGVFSLQHSKKSSVASNISISTTAVESWDRTTPEPETSPIIHSPKPRRYSVSIHSSDQTIEIPQNQTYPFANCTPAVMDMLEAIAPLGMMKFQTIPLETPEQTPWTEPTPWTDHLSIETSPSQSSLQTYVEPSPISNSVFLPVPSMAPSIAVSPAKPTRLEPSSRLESREQSVSDHFGFETMQHSWLTE